MKVIGSGFMKTGTKSLSHALKILGYKTYHIEEQMYFLGDQLLKALNEGCTTEEFREMFKDVDAITDLPSAKLWEEIHKAFPDAKIIHSERASDEEWTRSFEHHVNSMRQQSFARVFALITPTGRRMMAFIGATLRVAVSVPEPSLFTRQHVNLEVATMRYREHNTRVRQVAPKDQTLFFHPKDGWEPLCKFLGVPVPYEPFPHLNKKGSIVKEIIKDSKMFMQIRKELVIIVPFLIVLCAFLLYYLM